MAFVEAHLKETSNNNEIDKLNYKGDVSMTVSIGNMEGF